MSVLSNQYSSVSTSVTAALYQTRLSYNGVGISAATSTTSITAATTTQLMKGGRKSI